MKRRVPRRQTERARELRREPTPEEQTLWRILSRYRPKFTRQLPIGPYYGDLVCRRARLVVEVDGSQHAGSAHDARRTDYLQGQGWKVIRYWNSEVHENVEGVAQDILLKAAETLTGMAPQTIPSREGRIRRRRYD